MKSNPVGFINLGVYTREEEPFRSVPTHPTKPTTTSIFVFFLYFPTNNTYKSFLFEPTQLKIYKF